jgi:hypothetical protein
MNRLKMIINLLLGKNIIIYNSWNKEILCIIGSNEEIFKSRFTYDFISKDDFCLKKEKGKFKYIKEVE